MREKFCGQKKSSNVKSIRCDPRMHTVLIVETIHTYQLEMNCDNQVVREPLEDNTLNHG